MTSHDPYQYDEPQQQYQQYSPQFAPQPGQMPAAYQGRYGYVGPQQFEPLSPWSYFWHGVLFSIPLVGWIFLIIDCFTGKNINLRSFARSYFCAYVVAIIIFAIVAAIAAAAGMSLAPSGQLGQISA